MDIITQTPESPSNIEYLFNILKEVGLTFITDGGFDAVLMEEIKKLFALTQSKSDRYAPSFVDFSKLDNELDNFLAGKKDTPAPPKPYENDTEAENSWKEQWDRLSDLGNSLISHGIELKAVELGEKQLGRCEKSADWHVAWKKFIAKVISFNIRLSKSKDSFYFLSDHVFEQLVKYVHFPKGKFHDLLYDIASPRPDYAKIRQYRNIISAKTVKEIFLYAKERCKTDLDTFRASLFEAALAQETVKIFLLNICSAVQKQASITKSGTIFTNLEKDADSQVPFIVAGDQLYSVHMTQPELSGWGVRKDSKAMNTLKSKGYDFNGALFFTFQQYSDGTVMVSFDAYKDQNQFKSLIGQNNEDFVRLDAGAVCKNDQCEQFLEKASNAVIRFKTAVAASSKEDVSHAPGITSLLDKISKIIRNIFKGTASALSPKVLVPVAVALILIIILPFILLQRGYRNPSSLYIITQSSDMITRGGEQHTRQIFSESGKTIKTGQELQIKYRIEKDAYIYILFKDSSNQLEFIFSGFKKSGEYILPDNDNKVYRLDEHPGIGVIYLITAREKIKDKEIILNVLKQNAPERLAELFGRVSIRELSFQYK